MTASEVVASSVGPTFATRSADVPVSLFFASFAWAAGFGDVKQLATSVAAAGSAAASAAGYLYRVLKEDEQPPHKKASTVAYKTELSLGCQHYQNEPPSKALSACIFALSACIFAHLEKVEHSCKELRVCSKSAVQRVPWLGYQPHCKFVLVHDDGCPEHRSVCQQLERERG